MIAGRARQLRSLLFEDPIVIVPGVVDPWAARIAERSGLSAVLATGAGIANTQYGVPDLGLLGLREMAETVSRVSFSIDIPVMADADTGYGNALNVVQTVRAYEHAGAAGMLLEDQSMPKKCGHFEGKSLVPTEEMVQKIVAFHEAKRDPDLVLVARTDAIAVEGFDAAVRRANQYLAAGADAIFVEAPQDEDQLSSIPGLIDAPTIANMVEGGLTPTLPSDELQGLGYAGVIYANMAMRVAARAMEQAFSVLRDSGSSDAVGPNMLSWDERQEYAGLNEWKDLESRIVEQARAVKEIP